MKRALLYIGLTGAVMIISAGKCSTSKVAAGHPQRYYAGKVSVPADGLVATFTDCATVITMDISDNSNDAFKQLIANNNSENQVLYIGFFGNIEHPESGVPGEIKPIVTIDSIESVGDLSICSNFTLPGIYDTNMGAEAGIPRYLLRLRPNYTFTHSVYDEQGAEITSSGVWYRSTSNTLVLDYTGSDREPQTLDIAPEKESLSIDIGEHKQVYSKVYM